MDDGGSPFEGGRYHYVKLGEQHADEPESGPRSVPPPVRSGGGSSSRRGRLTDRVLGILLGLVLGVGIVTAYVFLGSEDTIDAPRIQNERTQGAAATEAGDRQEETNP